MSTGVMASNPGIVGAAILAELRQARAELARLQAENRRLTNALADARNRLTRLRAGGRG